ncbi:hypothetical protein UlMin_029145 [Ulmus minor]
MNTITNFGFLILATLLLHQINKVESNDLIPVACSTALDKSFCESSLRSQPESKGADLNGLSIISLKLAEANANKVTSQVSKLQQKETDKFVKAALTDCLENYQTALEEIQDSITAFKSKRYGDVNTWVTAAMTDAESCQDGFKNGQSPMTDSNTVFSRHCSNVLAITNKAAAGH